MYTHIPSFHTHYTAVSPDTDTRNGPRVWPCLSNINISLDTGIIFVKFCDIICFSMQDNKDLELDIIPASLTDDPEVKLRDPNHEVNEEKRKSARKKE